MSLRTAVDRQLVLQYNPSARERAIFAHLGTMRTMMPSRGPESPAVKAALDQSHRDLQAPDGGFSVSLRDGSSPHMGSPGDGYMVARRGHERVERLPRITRSHLDKYAYKNAKVLSKPNHYFGGWHERDTHRVYLDVSHHFTNRDEAVRFGYTHRQKAIFNLHTMESETI